jgi:glycosyltransferase involved in cell wall biosynthesis
MKVWAITMVRNEEDIIGFTLRHMISEGVDGIVVADNMSSDKTRDILEEIKHQTSIQVCIVDDKETGYYQSRKMTALARLAAEKGAHYVIPFDADELWYCMEQGRVADVLCQSNIDVAKIKMWNHFSTLSDSEDENPFLRMQWRMKERTAFFKVAYRYQSNMVIAQGNHDILDLDRIPVKSDRIPIGIRHFPYRSVAHFIQKAKIGGAAYAATDLAPHQGAHWKRYKRILDSDGPKALEEIFYRNFCFPDPQMAGMVYDPAPFMRHGHDHP